METRIFMPPDNSRGYGVLEAAEADPTRAFERSRLGLGLETPRRRSGSQTLS
jgi:hypothetical protein